MWLVYLNSSTVSVDGRRDIVQSTRHGEKSSTLPCTESQSATMV